MSALESILGPSIRRRLFALALGLTIPMAILAGARAFERSRFEERTLAERGTTSAARAAQLLDNDINRARLLLAGASRVLDPRQPAARNDSLIRMLFGVASAGFNNIWVTDTLGFVRGSLLQSLSHSDSTSLASREYFREVRRSVNLHIGQPVQSISSAAAPWVIPILQPVFDATTDMLIGYVGAGMKVDELSAVRYVRDLPSNSVLTVLRDDGRVLVRSRDLADWVNRSFAGSSAFKADPKIPGSMQRVTSLDGTVRLVAQDTLSTIAASVYVGIPVSESLALVERQFAIDLAIGILLTSIVAVVALVIANRIVTPLREVADVATALARGDRARRATVAGTDEVAVLANAFNGMADAVQDRQRELERSEARYRQLFATSPLPTLTWRLSDGRLEQVNDAARAFYGDERLLRADLRVLDLIAPEEQERFANVPLPSEAETVRAGLWTQTDAHGDVRTVELFVGRLEQLHQTVAVGVVLDVTERRRAELALEHSREQLRQAQQLEALGAFAGGIAHDFNNYLAAIGTNAELLQDDLPEASPLRVEATEILAAARRASHLTRQILVFGRRQMVQEQPLDIRTEFARMHHLLSRLVGEQIAVEINCADALPAVLFAQERFEQVFMNLAANARDAMPEGGRFCITADAAQVDTVRIRVEDTGVGMSEDVLSRIFEPFFSTKPRERGTGLGLAMVYSIVTGARGEITVQSRPGAGTVFTIALPGIPQRVTAEAPPVLETAPLRGREHVLVVEDDPSVRAATTALLARAGYRVYAADGADGALAFLEQADTPPDLMLTDVVMPKVGGPELAERVRARYPSVRVVFMSGYADDDAVTRGLADNALQLVAKPFSAGELLSAIRRSLDATPG